MIIFIKLYSNSTATTSFLDLNFLKKDFQSFFFSYNQHNHLANPSKKHYTNKS